MKKAESCECCIEKFTTTGCLNCDRYNLKNSLDELNAYIIENKNKLDRYEFYFNNNYEYEITNLLSDLNIPISLINFVTTFNDNELGVIIDKTKCDWGNIPVDWRDFYDNK